jgi:ribosomal protein S18 acetylase RimI-like enzyme
VTHLSLAIEPYSDEALAVIGNGLRAFNEAGRDQFDRSEFVVSVRTDKGNMIGGAKCKMGEGLLFIEWLWIDETARGGTGRDVMALAEAHAKKQGCTKAHLDTFNFQARGFYETLGYKVFGTLPYPHGGVERYYMSKDLKGD